MGRLAIVGGHAILGDEPTEGLSPETVSTDYGDAELVVGESRVLLQRHGISRYRTAAQINHRANLAALASLDVDRILAIGSVGGLKAAHGVGSVLVPEDFIALHLGLSFHDDHGGERVSAFDPTWRQRVGDLWARHSEREPLDGGVYWQAIGPRFETAAEIRLMAAHADVVGMTVASEAILAGELGISYAAVCIVDNLANGVGGATLSTGDFETGKATNRPRLLATLERVAADLGGNA